jgi:prevent-host-death family protein
MPLSVIMRPPCRAEKMLDETAPLTQLTDCFDLSDEPLWRCVVAERIRRGFRENRPPFARRDFRQRQDVTEVQASAAKAHFSQLLDEVERGASIVVLRHGRPIARIIPDPEGRRQRAKQAMQNIRTLAKQRRERFGPVTIEEIISSIHEGHKY